MPADGTRDHEEFSDHMPHDPRLNPFTVINQTLDDLCTTLEALVPTVASLQARVEAVEARMETEDDYRRLMVETGDA